MITYGNKISEKEYNDLRKAVGWNTLSKEQAERGLMNSAFLTVAYKDGKAVGMARVVGDGGYIVIIADVMVLPEFQGQGIGRQLMNNVMDYLKNSMQKNDFLMVNLMAAPNKEGFYKKFGFIERPNENMGAGMVMYLKKE
ncbi:MAG: GNAT family N-acetyltransferase [Epulopiscium sp.]|nr:GNAT family N-acetyltransferase [Candidatus Epulonipiscium sp.]